LNRGSTRKGIEDFFTIGGNFLDLFAPREYKGQRIDIGTRLLQAYNMSPAAIAISKHPTINVGGGFIAFTFARTRGRDELVITDVQGKHLDILFRELKDHAGKCGFSKIKLLRPEHNNALKRHKNPENLIDFYYTFANSVGLTDKARKYREMKL